MYNYNACCSGLLHELLLTLFSSVICSLSLDDSVIIFAIFGFPLEDIPGIQTRLFFLVLAGTLDFVSWQMRVNILMLDKPKLWPCFRICLLSVPEKCLCTGDQIL